MSDVDEALETDTYNAPTDGWVCFHCGVRFLDPQAAQIHFGRTPFADVGCLLKPEKRLLQKLRQTEQERDKWKERTLQAEERLEGQALEQQRVLNVSEDIVLRVGQAIMDNEPKPPGSTDPPLDFLKGPIKERYLAQARAAIDAILTASTPEEDEGRPVRPHRSGGGRVVPRLFPAPESEEIT